MPVISLMIVRASSCVDIECTKDLSILILSKASLLRREREEYPVPKSSMEIFTPRARSLLSVFIGVALSVKREDSVTSSSRRSGGSPVSFRMVNTIPAKALLLSWTGETLTEILAGTAQPAASLQAISSTAFPISLIIPVFSATGIKLSGDRRPLRGWTQRISAS